MTTFEELQVAAFASQSMIKWRLNEMGWSFGFNNAKRCLGVTKYRQKRIELSRYLVQLNFKDNFEEIKDTILHEIAHAIVGPSHGHGPVWKLAARQVGANPKACAEVGAVEMPKGNVVAPCKCDGQLHRRHRMPRKGYRYSCRRCKEPLTYRRLH